MVATFGWEEYTNATTTATPANLNLGSTLAVDLAPSTYPITAGTYSFEKWVRMHFSGTFTRIENLQFWKSAGAYVTGETIKWTGNYSTGATPIQVVSTIATTALPTADPGTANIGIGGNLAGSLSTVGDSDFIILQSSVTGAASAGATNTKTLTGQYDEV